MAGLWMIQPADFPLRIGMSWYQGSGPDEYQGALVMNADHLGDDPGLMKDVQNANKK
jgi:hypothetical protein